MMPHSLVLWDVYKEGLEAGVRLDSAGPLDEAFGGAPCEQTAPKRSAGGSPTCRHVPPGSHVHQLSKLHAFITAQVDAAVGAEGAECKDL